MIKVTCQNVLLNDKDFIVQTAKKSSLLNVKGRGAVFFTHLVKAQGKQVESTTCLYPVYYIPGLSVRLLLIGSLLNGSLELRGTSTSLIFSKHNSQRQDIVSFSPTWPNHLLVECMANHCCTFIE